VRSHSPLGSALVASPLAAALALPGACWQDPRFLGGVAALAGMAMWLVASPAFSLMRQYRCTLVRSHLALQWWCAVGVILLPAASAARLLTLDLPLMVRVALVGASLLAWLVVTLPLPSLYRPHLTARDDPSVTAITTSEELSIITATGVRLHARLYRPRQRPPLGLVVFTHGLGGWKEGFLNHLRVFGEAGWCVLTYDLRGCGRSSAAAITYGACESIDLMAVWSEAQRRAGSLPLVAAGASLGASLTIIAGMQLPGCRGCIIESPFADLNAALRRLMPGPLAAVARTVTRIVAGFDPAHLRPVAAPLLRSDIPLLLGWIADDRTIPATESAAVAAATPQARTIIMEHGEHLDMIVYAPWWRAVHAFLAEAAAKGRG
jgi:pimeloyl-ACP methyl ester carboxylesterase